MFKTILGAAALLLLPPTLSAQAACVGRTESRSAQSLVINGTPRFYFQHVPTSADCQRALPVIVEFHGVAGMGEVPPEEAFSHSGLVALAESREMILVRLRGVLRTGMASYAWDNNVEESMSFVRALLARLRADYRIDDKRLYASGFSNGTNFVTRFLRDPANPFAGLAVFAGGSFDQSPLPSLKDSAVRVYGISGAKDSMGFYMNSWDVLLQDAQLPRSQVFFRRTLTNHRISVGFFEEMLDFLDAGIAPATVEAIAGGEKISVSAGDPITGYGQSSQGQVVTTASGKLFRRNHSQEAWAGTIRTNPSSRVRTPFSDLCLRDDGVGLVASEGGLGLTRDHGKNWAVVDLPFTQSFNGRPPAVLSLQCEKERLIVGADTFYESRDGIVWRRHENTNTFFMPVTFASDPHTRSILGFSFYDIMGLAPPQGPEVAVFASGFTEFWINQIRFVKGRWLAMGDAGQMSAVFANINSVPLRARAIADTRTDIFDFDVGVDGTLAAAGSRGYLYISRDAGQSWTPIDVKGAGVLSLVRWVSPTELVVGTDRGDLWKLKP